MEIQLSDKIKSMFAKEFKNTKLNKKTLKNICFLIAHENQHYIIYRKFVDKVIMEFSYVPYVLVKYKNNKVFKIYKNINYPYIIHGSCTPIYPKKFNCPKYFPKKIFIETIQLIYDIIDRLFRFQIMHIFSVVKDYIKYIIIDFINTMFTKKIKELKSIKWNPK